MARRTPARMDAPSVRTAILTLSAEGLYDDEIAALLGWSDDDVAAVIASAPPDLPRPAAAHGTGGTAAVGRKRASRWTPEELERIRRRLREGETLDEVGADYGVTRERIRQLAGNLGRRRPPDDPALRAARSDQVRRLFDAGLRDEDIAACAGIGTALVKRVRGELGLVRPHAVKRHSREHSLWCASRWSARFGAFPRSTDWEPSLARRLGHHERALRWYRFKQEYGCPSVTTVVNEFGSWGEFIREASRQG